jgi:hypothetical protein
MAKRAALLVGLLAVAAATAAEQPSLEDILQVGASRPHGLLKWGVPKAEVRQMFPKSRLGIPPYDKPDSFRFQTSVSNHGCRYDVYLSGLTGSILTGIELRYARGIAPEKCRAQLEHLLSDLYGSPESARNFSWKTETTCIHLLSGGGEETETGPLDVVLGDRHKDCSYPDQVIFIRPTTK